MDKKRYKFSQKFDRNIKTCVIDWVDLAIGYLLLKLSSFAVLSSELPSIHETIN